MSTGQYRVNSRLWQGAFGVAILETSGKDIIETLEGLISWIVVALLCCIDDLMDDD